MPAPSYRDRAMTIASAHKRLEIENSKFKTENSPISKLKTENSVFRALSGLDIVRLCRLGRRCDLHLGEHVERAALADQ